MEHLHCALVVAGLGLLGCDAPGARVEAAPASRVQPPAVAEPAPPPEPTLAIADRGLWSELDAQVQVPADDWATATPARLDVRIDRAHRMATVWLDGHPRKVYPLLEAGAEGQAWPVAPSVRLRAGDLHELRAVTAGSIRDAGPDRDRDGDGIDDRLDIVLGAHKTAINADAYQGSYQRLAYPGGDVPRDTGVCTDVVVRALRNAGVDLQVAVHEDIRAAKRAYPMVRGRGDANIDHRRVKTLLPYFKRHWTAVANDELTALRPGDIVFMDTFPRRPGPDHIGIVSDARASSGAPLIINNWTDGTVTAPMDLLSFVPVTHVFRAP